jgi:hypothetical protein
MLTFRKLYFTLLAVATLLCTTVFSLSSLVASLSPATPASSFYVGNEDASATVWIVGLSVIGCMLIGIPLTLLFYRWSRSNKSENPTFSESN